MDKLDLQGTLLSADTLPTGLSVARPAERRTGKDRRHAEIGPPGKHDRRTALEARKPQVVELEMSPSEWAMFSCPPLSAGQSGH